jgi:hypothetical protein
MSELVLPVKQGEELNIHFYVRQDGDLMDISDYNIHFQVKKAPLEASPSLIDKIITEVSDYNDVGRITDPQEGSFFIHLTKKDTSFPIGDYALVIALEADNFVDIISSKCCNKAIYRICEQ